MTRSPEIHPRLKADMDAKIEAFRKEMEALLRERGVNLGVEEVRLKFKPA